jgi:hypothetical protein
MRPAFPAVKDETRFNEIIGTGGTVGMFSFEPNHKAFGRVLIVEETPVSSEDKTGKPCTLDSKLKSGGYVVGLMPTSSKYVTTFSRICHGAILEPATFRKHISDITNGAHAKYTILVRSEEDFKLLRTNLCDVYGKPKLNLEVIQQVCSRLHGVNPLINPAKPVSSPVPTPTNFDPFDL